LSGRFHECSARLISFDFLALGFAETIKQRASYCHEYTGESIVGYEELLKPIGELRLGNRVDTEKVNQFFSF
jgi:hypothetical protein